MDSIRKRVFKRSLLSSAVLLSIQTSVASAGTCPPPSIENNIHVSRGEFCEGGISPNSPVNDIGIEGYVSGDVVNNDGISDFWISSGTLEGSLINNNIAQDINISNGATITANIQNLSEMRHLRITGTAGNPTQVSGNLVNEGLIDSVTISGPDGSITGNIENTSDGVIANVISINDGASIGGDITNNGSANQIVVANEGIVKGDVINNYGEIEPAIDAPFLFIDGLTVTDNSSVEGNLVNNGNSYG